MNSSSLILGNRNRLDIATSAIFNPKFDLMVENCDLILSEIFRDLEIILAGNSKNFGDEIKKTPSNCLEVIELYKKLNCIDNEIFSPFIRVNLLSLKNAFKKILNGFLEEEELNKLAKDEKINRESEITTNYISLRNIRWVSEPKNNSGLVRRLTSAATNNNWEPNYTLSDFTTDVYDASTLVTDSTHYLIERAGHINHILSRKESELTDYEKFLKHKLLYSIIGNINKSFLKGKFIFDGRCGVFNLEQRVNMFEDLFSGIKEIEDDLPETFAKPNNMALKQLIGKIFESSIDIYISNIGGINTSGNYEDVTKIVYHAIKKLFSDISKQPKKEYSMSIGNRYKRRIRSFSSKAVVQSVIPISSPHPKNNDINFQF